MLKKEFEGFIKYCSSKELSEETKKIISLVFGEFPEIESRTNHSKINGMNRGDYIAHMIKERVDEQIDFPPDIIESESVTEEQISEGKKIGNLIVSNFRGFQTEKKFEFSDGLNLLYGPNGSGKSSFSEALEFALLGDVKERENRCKLDAEKYLENYYTKKFCPPQVFFKDGIAIEINENLYRFCFIEKNRILEFARHRGNIEAIEYLYGYGPFMEFIDKFNNDISPNLIKSDITSEESEKNETKTQITNTIDILNGQKTTNVQKLEQEAKNLGFAFSTFDKIKDDVSKKQSELDAEKTEKQNKVAEIAAQEKIQNVPILNGEIKEFPPKKGKKLSAIKRILSVLVFVSCFVLGFVYNFYRLSGIILIPFIFKLRQYIKPSVVNEPISIKTKSDDEINNGIEKSEKEKLQERIQKIMTDLKNIEELGKLIAIAENTITDLNKKQGELGVFEEENKVILESFAKKREKELKIAPFVSGYIKFISLLKDYMKEKILAGEDKKKLELRVIEIFNMLLGESRNYLQIKEIRLPGTGNENLFLKLISDQEINPLVIFSEGTLRCLGLSILLAKVIEDGVPFIICDDIVNAIDSDFRNHILDVFLNYQPLSNIQIIISTHSENFARTLKEGLGAREYKEYGITYTNSGTSFMVGKGNYCNEAEVYLSENNTTDCLHKCRLWLEKLIEKICEKYAIQRLSGEFYTSNGSVDTATKLNALIKYLEDKKDTTLNDLINNLKLIKPGTQFYRYLNEKSHENIKELEDVPTDDAREILQSMKTINDLLIEKK